MKILVLYYSRTGTTRNLATAIAKRLGADLGEITCPRFQGKGKLTFIMAGLFSIMGWLPKIQLPHEVGSEYDLVLIGSPVWTGYPALPVRTLMRDHHDLYDKIGLFLVGGNPARPQQALDMMEQTLSGTIVARLTCGRDEIKNSSFKSKLDTYISRIKASFAKPSAKKD